MSELAQPQRSSQGGSLVAGLIGAAAGAAFWGIVAIWLLYYVCGQGGRLPHHAVLFPFRVLSDWISLFSVLAFSAAAAMLARRYFNSRAERKRFESDFLSAEAGALLLPEDALALRHRFQAIPALERETILFRLLDTALQRARANWSAEDVTAAITTQAELIAEEQQAEQAVIRYLAWAIPSLGFLGTVLGIGQAMGAFGELAAATPRRAPATEVAVARAAKTTPQVADPAAPRGELPSPSDQAVGDATAPAPASAPAPSPENDQAANLIALAAGRLATAFDTTFVALSLSLLLTFGLMQVQAREDANLSGALQWCLTRFVLRMHIARPH